MEGSLCQGVDQDVVPLSALAVCDGPIVVTEELEASSPSSTVRVVDTRTGEPLAEIAVSDYDDFRPGDRVTTLREGVFRLDTGEGSVVIDLVEGQVAAAADEHRSSGVRR